MFELPKSRAHLLARRDWLLRGGVGLGCAALATLLHGSQAVSAAEKDATNSLPHHKPRAKRVIFLCQSGGPSQLDLFDPKPVVSERHGEELPDTIRMGQRLTTMTSQQSSLPIQKSPFAFAKHGKCGMELSELLPHTAKVVDDICLIRSLYTEAINHDPGLTLLQTGSQLPGRASMGSWLSYGLGSENENLPAFVVLISGGDVGDQPLYGRLWGAGFLPSQHQGVRLSQTGDLIPYLSSPPGVDTATRRRSLDTLAALNRLGHEKTGDAETLARLKQYELSAGMQLAVPELADLSQESATTLAEYGPNVSKPGSYARNCLLARRLVERGVRFVQLYHRDWDHHLRVVDGLKKQTAATDQPTAALLADLKQRGLLDDTLVIWGGEFGRAAYCQGTLDSPTYGRDHHPRCFAMWLAGGGIRPGYVHGETDDFSYNIVRQPMHINDLHATLLHLLGIDHLRLSFRSQGHDFRLTDVAGNVVREILA
ncbi:DUF1501 domain-containing protein [Anatilimnocola floriformis]|uniref:DUF1501 domain-containing protein n=1 Tax=Anatilimnocola floriformis TaxID=2948575 RepID=UPI0020C27791|nr:DUF1501 domain-containing protein [Anatilimnocola floriformis]